MAALLIIPHMGRKKYSMQGKQFGRNMLISEYLWIAYCCSLQPGQKAEERKRKQVSSHIQVVKKMFEKHRCCKSLSHYTLGRRPGILWRSDSN